MALKQYLLIVPYGIETIIYILGAKDIAGS